MEQWKAHDPSLRIGVPSLGGDSEEDAIVVSDDEEGEVDTGGRGGLTWQAN